MTDIPNKSVASLELCKELSELSGWGDTYFVWNHKTLRTKPQLDKAWKVSPRYNTHKQALESFTAYDLGYLLRKLPEYIELTSRRQKFVLQTLISTKDVRQGWQASYGYTYEGLADTPEDAAAKLAIELFKQGILERQPHAG